MGKVKVYRELCQIFSKNIYSALVFLIIASKNGVIRNDIAPEMIFRMLAGSLRLLIKQYGMSGNAFDLCSESTILFDTWDTLFKTK